MLTRRPADESPEDPEEFYDHQLVGLAAEDLDGEPLGEVTGVLHTARQDLLQVRAPDGRETLVPFVPRSSPRSTSPAGRVVIADRPGLRHRRPRGRGVRPTMRIDIVTIFPACFASLDVSLTGKAATRACSTSASTTCATGPTTGTAPSTTPPTAAAPAW